MLKPPSPVTMAAKSSAGNPTDRAFWWKGGRRGGGKSPMLWQVFSVQMANSRRFMHMNMKHLEAALDDAFIAG